MNSNAINTPPAVYVYEIPVRVWHVLNALIMLVLIVTGYLIANPLASVTGEASAHFVMGYIRFIHFTSGFLLVVGLVFRIVWAFIGNTYARQFVLPPLLSKSFWSGVWHEILWYSFIDKRPRKYIGHNPLAILFMHLILFWGTLFMIVTGFAMYGEGAGQHSWQFTFFSSWVIPLFGQSQNVHSWHHLMMWFIICFVITHIYVAIREDKLSRQSLLATIATGWRTFKDDEPCDD